jgi:hypothetical protein
MGKQELGCSAPDLPLERNQSNYILLGIVQGRRSLVVAST